MGFKHHTSQWFLKKNTWIWETNLRCCWKPTAHNCQGCSGTLPSSYTVGSSTGVSSCICQLCSQNGQWWYTNCTTSVFVSVSVGPNDGYSATDISLPFNLSHRKQRWHSTFQDNKVTNCDWIGWLWNGYCGRSWKLL